MTEEDVNKADKELRLYDKSTGKQYICLSTTILGEIKHYHLECIESGDIILLSESGLKLRFHDKPDIGTENLKNIFLRAVYKK